MFAIAFLFLRVLCDYKRKAAIEPNEQGASPRGALLQDVELIPQHQDFDFKPSSRLCHNDFKI
jgi:hypothetical protein